MRSIGFESRLIELSNGSRITSIGVQTKPGRAREVGSIICLNKRSLDRSKCVWIDPKWSGSQQKVLDRSEKLWIDPKRSKTPSDYLGSIQLCLDRSKQVSSEILTACSKLMGLQSKTKMRFQNTTNQERGTYQQSIHGLIN
jgi:hypothetical protein